MKLANSPAWVAARSAVPILILFHGSLQGGQPALKSATAPPLRECKVSASTDMGLWDDFFVPPDKDFIVLRRGDEIFSLAMSPDAAPKRIAKVPAAEHTHIATGAVIDKRCWLFMNARKAAPFVLDANSGTVVAVEVPGVKIPGSHPPGIGAWVLVPHAKAAILAVSGGDRETWPRAGNHSVYFWFDLSTGKITRFPIDWDLDYFSANERIAVFAVPSEKRFERRPLQAIDMATGDRTSALPDWKKTPCIPYNWTDKERVKPLDARRPGAGDASFFAGLSVGGVALPIDLGLKETWYLARARARDRYAGFRLRSSGASRAEPNALRVVSFKDLQNVATIDTDVTDFTMLGNGNVLYVKVIERRKPPLENREHAEAFFHVRADRSMWNVLDGVERLPELDKAFADNEVISDRMMITLIEGFGSDQHDAKAFCIFDHHRGDDRALAIGMERLLESINWRRTLLVTQDGRRCLTPLLREGNLPDCVWLHNSGKLLIGTYVWSGEVGDRIRQLRLSEVTVQMP
jgi:hypothetical protein